jgi:hypothetical protein
VLEENLLEKNSDETEMMLDYFHSKPQKSKLIDPMMVGIVGRMHDEENQHQMLIILKSVMMGLNPARMERYNQIELINSIYWFCLIICS